MFESHGCRTVGGLVELVGAVPLYLGPAPGAGGAGGVPRLAVVSNSGASCVLAADEAQARGLPLARLSADAEQRLAELLPNFSLNRNPVDLTAMLLAEPALLGAGMQVVLQDAAVDAAVLGLLAVGGPSYDLARFVRESRAVMDGAAKPLAVYSPHAHVRAAFAQAGFAVFAGEAEAMQALQAFALHRGASATSPTAPAVFPFDLPEPQHA
jgi:acyl-CoA synthetase (NDP forming)